MKGIIFNILEDYVSEKLGDNAFDDFIEKLDYDGVYVGPETYSNEEFLTLVATASEEAKLELPAVVKDFGVFTFWQLYKKFPIFMEPHSNAKDFLKTIHDVIHVEVKKIFKDPELPDLFYNDIDKNLLHIDYHSPKQLCIFMEGLLEGVKELYEENFDYNQLKCTHTGSEFCRFELKFNYG